MAACAVSVVLGDGTKHDIAVTVGPSADPACNGVLVVTSVSPDFTSPTCIAPFFDGGNDGD
jgi:hypothetical protein